MGLRERLLGIPEREVVRVGMPGGSSTLPAGQPGGARVAVDVTGVRSLSLGRGVRLVAAGSARAEHPALGSDMTVATGVTEAGVPARMRVHTLSVTVPSAVELEVRFDGALQFHTPGDESGDWVLGRGPLESWPLVEGGVGFRWDNPGGAARVRALVMGVVTREEPL